jgi:archaellum component FlaG (FlaF/FlaG flagellin family)
MNSVLIVFLVAVILIAILVIAQIYNPSFLIQDSRSLRIDKDGVQQNISIENIDNPGSVRYFYEGWFFIDANEPVKSCNILFNRGSNFIASLTGSTLNIYVNVDKSKVKPNGTVDASGLTPLLTVQNFPFQKWCHLVINVDGTTVDLYIDGKFVKNTNSQSQINTNNTDPISYGNIYTLGHFTRFRRVASSINPQGVWSSYMNGSGQGYSISNYHVNAQITKNKQTRIDQRLI